MNKAFFVATAALLPASARPFPPPDTVFRGKSALGASGRALISAESAGNAIRLMTCAMGARAPRVVVVTGNVAHYEAIRATGGALGIENWRESQCTWALSGDPVG